MRRKGPWSTAYIRRFREESRAPIRLARNGASGHPVLASLWFVPLDGRLWCATRRTAGIASPLSRDPRGAFEVSAESPPYRAVRGPAVATLHEDRGEEIFRMPIDRYLEESTSRLARFLLARAENEVAIAIEPRALVSWDCRERMGDAA